MRIVVHGGLHKSGTTSVQASWKASYGAAPVLFPAEPRRGHHPLFWPLLAAYVDDTPADLLRTRHGGRDRDPVRLAASVAEAARVGVETLLLSTEELDRLTAADVERVGSALVPHRVEWLLTVTRPVHRWCAGWQELVKHGCGDYPAAVPGHIARFASLEPGRLAELVRLAGALGATRRVVRLVRTDPAEPDLSADLARTFGLPAPAQVGPVRNRSLGRDVEVLRRVNRADAGGDEGARKQLAALRGEGFAYREVPGLAEEYALPAVLSEAAQAEAAFLAAPGSEVEVVDPHGLLGGWTELTPPAWWAQVSRQEAVVPGLDDPPPVADLLWRAREERDALRAALRRGLGKLDRRGALDRRGGR